MEWQTKLDTLRVKAASTRSAWVSECFLASIATDDSSFAEAAEAAETDLYGRIDALVESAPSMDSIIAVHHLSCQHTNEL